MAALTHDKCLSLLACRRPDQRGKDDKAMREALQRAAADPALKECLEIQEDFDRGVAKLVHGLPLPEGLNKELGALFESARLRGSSSRDLLRQPALWAVLLAVAFLLTWGGLVFYEHLRGFPGDDGVARLVEAVSANASSQRLEPLAVECGNLGDALFLEHGIDNFVVPEQFARYGALGYRVFENNSFPVTQVMVREHGMTFLVFRADQQGVRIDPPGRWKYLQGEQWAAAARVRDNICFVAACRGDKEQLRSYLKEASVARRQAAKRQKAQEAREAKDAATHAPDAQNQDAATQAADAGSK
jgi:hypothetical protein